MKSKVILFSIFTFIFLAACGGSATEEPVVEAEPVETEVVEEDVVEEEPTEEATAVPEEETEAEEAVEEEPEAEEAMEEEAMEEEATEEPVEEETAEGFGDIPMSGVDADTGLEINPESYGPGDTFIVRGTIISMNLTPVTSPEFLIESPDGARYRINSQPIDETFFTDGTQWQAFEYRQGVGAMATVVFDSSLSLSDVPSSDDLVLVMQE